MIADKERRTVLEARNIVKQFGGLTAVNNVSMHVNEGEIVGLIGANGAGKTTLFNMIAGVFLPTSGRISFMGQEIQGLPCHKMCRLGIGRTYQIVKPFVNLSVLDNTVVGALNQCKDVKSAREKARKTLDFVGLGHRMDVSSRNLNLPELKRLELARALATEPKLLLLDEVMAGLNPTDSGRVIELVRRIRDERGITIIVIEHVMKAIMTLSNRIYVLNQGSLVADGTPEEVSKNPEVIKSYFGEKRYAKN